MRNGFNNKMGHAHDVGMGKGGAEQTYQGQAAKGWSGLGEQSNSQNR